MIKGIQRAIPVSGREVAQELSLFAEIVGGWINSEASMAESRINIGREDDHEAGEHARCTRAGIGGWPGVQFQQRQGWGGWGVRLQGGMRLRPLLWVR